MGERLIADKHGVLVVEQMGWGDKYKSLNAHIMDDGSVSIAVSQHTLDEEGNTIADGIYDRFAFVWVSPAQAKAFAEHLLNVVGE